MVRLAIAAVAVVLGFGVPASAADEKNDPTGTWKWEVEFNGNKRTQTLKLELKDGKLTGAMIGMNNMETAISDATFKDGEVKFTVVRERNNMKVTSKYAAKVDGDTMKGSVERDAGGQTNKTEFEAKKEKK
jgi:hypothetical protein